jgi:shikimate kinase
MDEFRDKASVVLNKLFLKVDNLVIAGTQTGLKYSYLRVYKKHKKSKDIISIHILDRPENVLKRLTFYDKDSKPREILIDDSNKKAYLKEIIGDYNYYKNSYKRADLEINIENVNLENIPDLIIIKLNEFIASANVISYQKIE